MSSPVVQQLWSASQALFSGPDCTSGAQQFHQKPETKHSSILLTSSPCYCRREGLQKKTPPVSSHCWVIHWSDSLPNRKLSGNHFKLNECMFSEAGYGLLRFWQCFKARKGCCKLTDWNQSTLLPTIYYKPAPKLQTFVQYMSPTSAGASAFLGMHRDSIWQSFTTGFL